MNGSDSCFGQEVELKLRVPSAEALRGVAEAAGGESLGTTLQRNVFFDTPEFAWPTSSIRVRRATRTGTSR